MTTTDEAPMPQPGPLPLPGTGIRPRPRRARTRRVLILVLGVLLLITAGAAVTTRSYVFPREDAPGPADAIFVLGGLSSAPVVNEALALADAGYSDHIVISDAFGGDTRPAHLCARQQVHEVECFHPDPSNTHGEAQAIADFAKARGWSSVIVVTTTYHVSRARVQIEQCFAGTLRLEGAPVDLDLSEWAYQYLYQTAGFVKVWLNPGC